MTGDTNEVGKRMAEIREASGLPKTFLAKKLGISYSQICKLEYGKRKPTPEFQTKFASFFGVNEKDIFL